MNSKLWKILALSALAVGMSACTEDEPNTPQTPACMQMCIDATNIVLCDVNGEPYFNTCDNGCNLTTNSCNPAVEPPPFQPECSHLGTMCVGNDLVSCVNGVVTNKVTCENGCVNNACKVANVGCTADVCQDGTTLLVCNPDGTTTPQVCENGCAGNKCVEGGHTGCTEDVCQDGTTLLVCNPDGSTTPQVCENGCADDKCVEGSDPEPEPEPGDYYDCSDEICTEEGDTCVKACNDAGYTTDKAWCDDEYVYCSDPNGGGSEPEPGDYYDCSDEICTEEGDTCVQACNDAGYTTDKAWCDDEYVYCSDPNGGGSDPEPEPGEYYDCSNEICTEEGDTCVKACNDAGYSTDKAWCDDQYVYCEDPNASLSACAYETKCDGNTLWECADYSWIGLGVYEFDTNCDELGQTCAIVDGVAGCLDTCTTEGDVSKRCEIDEEYGDIYSVTMTCSTAEDGNLYNVESYTTCFGSCDETTGECIKLHEDEGKTCDESYATTCSDDIMLECGFYGTVEPTNCAAEGEGYTCRANAEGAECVKTCTAEEEGQVMTECLTSLFGDATYVYTCTNGFYEFDSANSYYCSTVCDADGISCVKNLENEGEACEYGVAEETCVENVVSYCSEDGKVTALVCDVEKGYSCKALADQNYADCYTAADTCTNVGESSTSCFEYGYYGNVVGTVTCMTTKDGSAVNVITAITEQCDGGYGECNAEGTACAESSGGTETPDPGIGEDYTPSTKLNSCEIADLTSVAPFGACTEAQLECEIHVCWYDEEYTGYYTEYLTCMDLGGEYGLMWYPEEGTYMACNNQCAASSQACDDNGGEYQQYQ